MKHLTKWLPPLILTFIVFLIISYIISYTNNQRQKYNYYKSLENFTPSAKNLSPEIAEKLLPNLKTYLNYKYPKRSDLTSFGNNSHNKIWENLSQNDPKNDFVWNIEPSFKDGYLTKGNSLQGPPGHSFDFDKTKDFTIIIRATSLEEPNIKNTIDESEVMFNADLSNQGKDMTISIPAELKLKFEALKKNLKIRNQESSKEAVTLATDIAHLLKSYPTVQKIKNPIAIRFNGNDDVALDIAIPDVSTHGLLQYEIAGNKFSSEVPVLAGNDQYYTIVYKNDGTGANIKAYVNKTKVHDTNITNKMYLNESPVVINPMGSWNANLKEVAILNTALEVSEIELFRNSGVIVSTLAHKYGKENVLPGITPPKGCKNCSGTCKVDGITFDPYKEHPNVKFDLQKDCETKCDCEKELPEVTKDEEGYYTWNGKKYSKSKRIARDIYLLNHPDMKQVPDILDYPERQSISANCPFTIENNMNPCKAEACENVDWSAHTPQGVSQKCKKDINLYCEKYPYHDDFCTCWRDEYRNTPECQKYRSKFMNPKDCNVTVNMFNIEDHPDFNKYIRKDKIPCWNCDVK